MTPPRRFAPYRRVEVPGSASESASQDEAAAASLPPQPGSPIVATLPQDAAVATVGAVDLEVYWDADVVASPDVDDSEGAGEFAESLQRPAFGSAAANTREAADHAAACAEALGESDQPGRRYRAVAWRPGELETKALVQAMRPLARAELSEFEGGTNLHELPWPPGSASGGSQEFLRAAHNRVLRVTQLQGLQAESEDLRAEFSKLLEDFPKCCGLKFGEDTFRTARGRAHLVVGLVKKHSGEVVELGRVFACCTRARRSASTPAPALAGAGCALARVPAPLTLAIAPPGQYIMHTILVVSTMPHDRLCARPPYDTIRLSVTLCAHASPFCSRVATQGSIVPPDVGGGAVHWSTKLC